MSAFFHLTYDFEAHPHCSVSVPHPFQGWLIFHCTRLLHFVYLFLDWWTFGFLPAFWLLCFSDCTRTSFVWIVFSELYLRSGIARSFGTARGYFFEKLPDCFPPWLPQCILPPAMSEGLSFSPSLPTPVTVYYRYCRGCEMACHSGVPSFFTLKPFSLLLEGVWSPNWGGFYQPKAILQGREGNCELLADHTHSSWEMGLSPPVI